VTRELRMSDVAARLGKSVRWLRTCAIGADAKNVPQRRYVFIFPTFREMRGGMCCICGIKIVGKKWTYL